jgi:hypothetical protein
MSNEPSSFYRELESLLKFAKENAEKPFEGSVDAESEARLTALEKAFANWKRALLSSPEMQDKNQFENLPKLNEQQRERFKQWFQLGISAATLSTALKLASETFQRKTLRKIGKNTKKSIQKRQRKFKGAGGNKKWKKL